MALGPLGPQGQRSQAAGGQPAIERRPTVPSAHDAGHALPVGFAAAQQAEQHVAVPVHDLGQAFVDEVGAPFQRSEDGRPRKRVIDQQPRAGGKGKLAQAPNVDHAQQRVGDDLGHDQRRSVPTSGGYRKIAAIDHRRRHSQAGGFVDQQVQALTI